jgi:hypothetical protein
VTGPAGVMALVLAETAAGAAAFLFLSPLWNEVRTGFFLLTGAVVLVLAGSATLATSAGFDTAITPEARLARWLCVALAMATLVWLGLLVAKRRPAARALGLATVPLAGAVLVAFARTTDQSFVSTLLQLAAGAVFTGAVLDGLLLGHWYLTDRKLTRGPINRITVTLLASVVLEGAALIVAGFGEGNGPGPGSSGSLNPLLSLSGSAAWIAFGMVLCTGLIAVFIKVTLKGPRPSAVQAATGFFYLAVITAFTAELAAKVRFLP